MTNKYLRQIKTEVVDVYDVLVAFNVTNPAIAHAIKKLLMPGARGSKSWCDDVQEAVMSLYRALEINSCEQKKDPSPSNPTQENRIPVQGFEQYEPHPYLKVKNPNDLVSFERAAEAMGRFDLLGKELNINSTNQHDSRTETRSQDNPTKPWGEERRKG